MRAEAGWRRLAGVRDIGVEESATILRKVARESVE